MPIHIYWGEDEFLMSRVIKQLRSRVLDERWASFNYSEYPPDSKDSIPQAIADIMTPPLGTGGRLVYLPSSTLLGVCPKEMLQQLEHILAIVPATNFLLITTINKPDSRNKSVKLLLQFAQVKEFPSIPQWQTDTLIKQARNLAKETGIEFAPDAYRVLVEAVGNNTRLLVTQLEKLKVYANGVTVNADTVRELVTNNATNSLQLASAIRTGNVSLALKLVEDLIARNEPALKIAATLTTTFRTWLVVKLCIAANWQDDSAIAFLAEIKNPKRLYFLRQEVASIPASNLQKALSVLLELELMLKNGWDEKTTLQTQIVKICA
ncbi:DNA polymerase III subunit delta [Chroococcidiopsis thermalis]|uniref:DNA polymerase III subunit delta n=1 Tax=Chroococcidiopsis thermalis (strain PCC 7203) TaxID=251229 RepID=K9U2L5_CHRTP|nr:DNA polymerase III subunit delta [Chroococcidiopsis thermalis]AFY89312.1 DNA polymerase III, delta subunit [Chroococcidiopsis thermalis PCC 7203]